MWWFGNDSHEEDLSLALDRLQALLGDDASYGRGLLGFGTALRRERRMLLLIVEQRLDPRPEQWIPSSHLFAVVLRRWLRRYDLPLLPEDQLPEPSRDRWPLVGVAIVRLGRRWWWVRQLTALALAVDAARRADPQAGLVTRGLAVPLRRADEGTQLLADRIPVSPEDVLVMYRPMPKATNGHLRGVRRRPTASPGFQLAVTGGGVPAVERLLATAGHFAVAPAAPVYRSARRFVRGPAIGTMRRRLDPRAPMGPPGPAGAVAGRIDLGLVALNGDALAGRPVEVQPADEVEELAIGRWDGASSGRSVGQVIGSLRMIEVDGVRLANCWFLLGDCRPGDSGSAVLHDSGRLLGQVVGALGVRQVDGARPGTIVQDVELLLDAAADVLGRSRQELEPAVLDPL
jgi:hypothetical protein